MTPLMEARGITYAYTPGRSVVDHLSAEFHAGQMTALTGPSGRGKSTLLYLLGLMLRPHSGDVFVRGLSTGNLADSERAALRAHQFGFVFQDAALDSTRTVIDNVVETTLYRGGRRKDDMVRALRLLREFDVDLPATRRPGEVSGGQAQRIALCRALLNEPHILLADEPTGNLDSSTAAVVIDAMRGHAARGATVIVVTHSSQLADACDREIRL